MTKSAKNPIASNKQSVKNTGRVRKTPPCCLFTSPLDSAIIRIPSARKNNVRIPEVTTTFLTIFLVFSTTTYHSGEGI